MLVFTQQFTVLYPHQFFNLNHDTAIRVIAGLIAVAMITDIIQIIIQIIFRSMAPNPGYFRCSGRIDIIFTNPIPCLETKKSNLAC